MISSNHVYCNCISVACRGNVVVTVVLRQKTSITLTRINRYLSPSHIAALHLIKSWFVAEEMIPSKHWYKTSYYRDYCSLNIGRLLQTNRDFRKYHDISKLDISYRFLSIKREKCVRKFNWFWFENKYMNDQYNVN